MKRMLKIVVWVLALVLSLSVIYPALAASLNGKIDDTNTYTITTRESHGETLKVVQNAGKAYATKFGYLLQGKVVPISMYGKYEIQIVQNDSLIAVQTISDSEELIFRLEKDSVYEITVTYLGFGENVPDEEEIGYPWNPVKWKSYPSVKVDVR